MDLGQFEALLDESIQDERLSRRERKDLRSRLRADPPDYNKLAALRNKAFEVARRYADATSPDVLFAWLEDVMQALHAPVDQELELRVSEAHFSPGEQPRSRIRSMLRSCRKSADICVFTISDDALSSEIYAAHQRGIQVRLISDDDKSNDLGSDVEKLARRGVPVVMDNGPAHMHHKFAIFDGSILLSGSYNWTRSAASANSENILLTADTKIVAAFQQSFEALWETFGGR